MTLSRMAVTRPVLTTVIIAVFLVMGISSYLGLVVDLFPDVEFPFVTVTTIYPGAGPEEMESQVSKKLEDAVSTIADIKRLDSINQESLSLLLIEFELGVDADLVAIDVKEKVEGVLNELPDEVEKPEVVKFEMGSLPIISLSLTGPQSLREIYDVADRLVEDDLSRATGVASVDIVGGQRREIQVALDPAKLAAFGLDATQVSQAVAMGNLNVPAGRLLRSDQEFTVRVLGEFADLEELRNLPVNLPGSDRRVRIRDLGRVVDGTEEARALAQADGANAVAMFIMKRTDANTVGTADAIYGRVEALNQRLPAGMTLNIMRDESTFIRSTVRDVLINILLGILLTTVILYLFLHNIRTTVVAALAMPTSIIATFLLIDFGGFTINMMTLLALGISIGVLVTNAIVVLESIASRLEEGEEPAAAAEKGTNQVAIAVAATALTNIVVFTPIATMGGIVGRFFIQFGLTVVFATVISLLVSFTLTPMLASKLLKSRREQEEKLAGHGGLLSLLETPFLALARIWERGYKAIEQTYRGSLGWAVAHRFLTLLMVVVIFVSSLMLFQFVGGEFMPESDENFVQVLATLPAGSTLDQTREVMEEIREIALREIPEAETTLLTVGGEVKGVEEGEVTIRVCDPDQRERSIFQIINEIRPALAVIPAADIVAQIQSGWGDQQDIIVDVLGPEMDMVTMLAESLRVEMSTIPGLVDLDVSAKPGKPEIVFRPDREELAGRMFSLAQVGGELRGLYEGSEASVYREGGEEYDIRVQLNEHERGRVSTLPRVRMSGAQGQVPLSALGDLDRRRGLAEITRKNKERTVTVTANIGSGTLMEKIDEIQMRADAMNFPEGYRIEFSGDFEMMGETFAEIFKALILAIVLTYLVLAAILESFVHPLTIMFTLPLGLVGVAGALFLTGATINLFSLMAVVMLVGIVVNNAILILDYAAVLRKEGQNARDAILKAAPGRLRPIVMATLAILAGIFPQAVGGAGAAYTVAMAVTTMGGVLASGILALYLIPVLYTMFDRFTSHGRRDRAQASSS